MRLKLLSLAVYNINQLKQEVLLWLTMGVADTVIEVGSDSKRIPKMRSSDSHLRIIPVPQMDRDNPKLEVPSAFLVIIQISPHPNNTTPLTTNNRLSWWIVEDWRCKIFQLTAARTILEASPTQRAKKWIINWEAWTRCTQWVASCKMDTSHLAW